MSMPKEAVPKMSWGGILEKLYDGGDRGSVISCNSPLVLVQMNGVAGKMINS